MSIVPVHRRATYGERSHRTDSQVERAPMRRELPGPSRVPILVSLPDLSLRTPASEGNNSGARRRQDAAIEPARDRGLNRSADTKAQSPDAAAAPRGERFNWFQPAHLLAAIIIALIVLVATIISKRSIPTPVETPPPRWNPDAPAMAPAKTNTTSPAASVPERRAPAGMIQAVEPVPAPAIPRNAPSQERSSQGHIPKTEPASRDRESSPGPRGVASSAARLSGNQVAGDIPGLARLTGSIDKLNLRAEHERTGSGIY